MSYQPKVYRKLGGDELVVASGGQITVESGGEIELQTGATFQVNASNLDVAELAYLDGITAGAGTASKAVILDANKTFRLGGFNTAAALTLAVPFTASLDFYSDGQVDVFSVFGGSGADLTSAKSAKSARFRHVVNCTTAAHETYGAVGQLVIKDTTLTHLHAGLMGTFEGNTSGVVCNSAYEAGHACVIGRLGGHSTITATTPVAGFLAFNNGSAALASGSSYGFTTAVRDASYPWTVGLFIPADSCTTAIDSRGLVTVASTITSATPATTRLVRSELTVTPSSGVAVGSNGSLAGIRGCVTLTTGKQITDGYLYGVQGKLVVDGATIANGSDHACAVLAQISGSGTTFTSGHNAALICSGQSLPASANVNMIYLETGGNTINAAIQSNCRSTYFLDINNFESCGCCSSTVDVSTSSSSGNIKVLVDGAVRYIKLYSS